MTTQQSPDIKPTDQVFVIAPTSAYRNTVVPVVSVTPTGRVQVLTPDGRDLLDRRDIVLRTGGRP
jgi:hypothetical protein